MPEVIPCPECGEQVRVVKFETLGGYIISHDMQGDNRKCLLAMTLIMPDRDALVAAWNALPRMSTIIAWQFQASGAALALQRLMDAAQAMRDEQRYWGNLIGTSTDMLITPAINQAACILGNAEDELDGLLDKYRKTLNFVK